MTSQESANQLIRAILDNSDGHEASYIRVKRMLEEGTNPNGRDEFGETPLYVAAKWNEPAMCILLVKFGADVNSTDGSGETALAIAAFNRNPDVVKVLLDAGSDPDAGGENGRTDGTARHTAWWNNSSMGPEATRCVREMLSPVSPYPNETREMHE